MAGRKDFKVVKDPWGVRWAIRKQSFFKRLHHDRIGSNIKRELLTLKWIRDHASPERLFVDVGAHVGYYAIRLAPRFRQTYALEPNTFNYQGLRLNMRLNKSWNLLALNIGASDHTGQGLLYCAGGGSTLFNRQEYVKTEDIKLYRLDDLAKSAQILKIDTEGHEVEVLKGAAKLLKTVEAVVVENHVGARIHGWRSEIPPSYWEEVQDILAGFEPANLEGQRFIFTRKGKGKL
jgi:FkbM family methyltransferase